MHELRNKLYEENCPLTNEELDILNFETIYTRVYDDLYNNGTLNNFIDRLRIYNKWLDILENEKNKPFFKKLFDETWILITSDRELSALWIVASEHEFNLNLK